MNLIYKTPCTMCKDEIISASERNDAMEIIPY